VSCPICEKRKAERFCPAKGEKICAICCGTYREVTIDCPADCSHLVAAHRYEDEHPRSLAADAPRFDEKIPQDIIHTHQRLMAALAFSIAKFCATQSAAVDADVLAAIQALAHTHKTLSSGILYEKPPDAPLPRELYAALAAFLAEIRKQQADRVSSASLRDTDIFYLLVFLHRMGLLRSNGRARSRRFIEFLRGQFPQSPELKREESRIIVP
jgi:flagellar biosynthesis regulator FlaF